MSKAAIVLVVLLCALAFALRLVHLSADPPENLSLSAGEYGDPGAYAHNARNKVLFGTWSLDALNLLYVSPLPHAVTYLVFKTLGVGITQMNLVPILFSALALIFFTLLVRNWLSSILAVAAYFVLSLNYLFTMYSRIANRVMPMVFFLVLALYFFLKGEKKRFGYFLGGFSLVLAFSAKGVCLYVIAAFGAGVFFRALMHPETKAKIRILLGAGAGFLAAFALWFFAIYLPHKQAILALSSINKNFLIPPKSIAQMLQHFWSRPAILFENMPGLMILANIAFLFLLFKLVHKPKDLTLVEWILFFWFAGGFLYFALIYQRVTRHYVPQIIPVVLLTLWLLKNFVYLERVRRPGKPKVLFVFVMAFWLAFPLSFALRALFKSLPQAWSGLWPATGILAAASFLVSLLVFVGIRLWPENLSFAPSRKLRAVTAAALFLVMVDVQVEKTLAWAFHPEYKIRQISDDIGKAFPGASVAGLWAPVVSLENKSRAYQFMPGYINDDPDFLKREKIALVLATNFFGGQEVNNFRRYFPEAMGRARLVANYPAWRGNALLYELNPPETQGEPLLYEAEAYTEKAGFPCFEPQASGRFAVIAAKKKPGFVVAALAPDELKPGKHKAFFRLKTDGRPEDRESRLARLDVISGSENRVLAIRNITASDFSPPDQYQDFALEFTLKRAQKPAFRVFSEGLADFLVDSVRVVEDY